MKYFKFAILGIILILFTSCDNNNKGFSGTINDKETYLIFRKEIEQVKQDFQAKKISEKNYAKRMENYGDVFVKNVDGIPAERRYRMSIYCYQEAVKYNKSDNDLKEKLQKQKTLFQVIDHN